MRPDRVARRRTGNQVLLSTGISAEMAGEPPPYEFMLAIDMLPPSVQSIIHAEGVRCRGCGSIRTMSGSNSGE